MSLPRPWLLGLDLETTGLDPVKDRLTEIGAVLWDGADNVPVRLLNGLVRPEPGDAPSPAEVVAITGITDAMRQEHGSAERVMLTSLALLMEKVDAVVAHNGTTFDRPFLAAAFDRVLGEPMPEVLWIDTCTDVAYPSHITTRKLVHLAAEHGFLNPFAHRAVFDVLTMLTVASRYGWDPTMEAARTPNVTLIAQVSYDEREKAKAAGFRWDAGGKGWTRIVKANRVEEVRAALEFGTVIKA